MKQTPILIMSDAPAAPTGLGRIGKDIALVAASMPELRVGYFGRGYMPTRKLPFMQYTFGEEEQWGERWLQWVWQDFANMEEGVLMTIWDPSRLHWLADPKEMPNEKWLRKAPFKKWGYFPVDATGPDLALTSIASDTVSRYDRVLAYGIFGANVLAASLGGAKTVDWLPHGINLDVFRPRDRKGARVGFGLRDDTILLGVVMTNQERKDWGLAFKTVQLLAKRYKGLRAWMKTDSVDRHWDLRALSADYGVEDVVLGDMQEYVDEELSYLYSACDLTFLPSLGEGFGYPIVESLACGVPCVHGTYGGGAELIQDEAHLVAPQGYRLDTRYNCTRPVYNAEDWAAAIDAILQGDKQEPEYYRAQVAHLDWKKLSVQWKKWFMEGIKDDTGDTNT